MEFRPPAEHRLVACERYKGPQLHALVERHILVHRDKASLQCERGRGGRPRDLQGTVVGGMD